MNYSNFNEQRKIIINLVAKANEVCPAVTIQKTSLFFSFFYAIVLLKPKSSRQKRFEFDAYNKEYMALYHILPEASEIFKNIYNSLKDEQIQAIYKQLKEIEIGTFSCDNTISWLYQSLKKGLEKAAFEKIGKSNNKIKGKDLLYTTQFFTDEYMVKFLVDSCLQENQDNITNIVFVDPALGGGNFLTYAFVALFSWYKINTRQSPVEIINKIISDQLLGYDLDAHMPIIAKLSLYINIVARVGLLEINSISYYGGKSKDVLGFMAKTISSESKHNLNFQKHLNKITHSKNQIIYITNPPFMGKRDMEPVLKNELLNSYPQCKGDLCFSFMYKLMTTLREQDILALVSQNGWMNLSSLKKLRENILDHYYVHSCADLGSNAFFAINGEKTNIVLTIITPKKANKISNFYNLKGLSYSNKKEYLANKNLLSLVKFSVNQEKFRANPSYEFSYELVNSFMSLNSLDQYSYYANPMQGSSTGNNESFVKYAWESVTNSKEWKLVSKGGGFSRWQGLNIYKVKWGKKGELIINNPGSAIRNLKEIPFTELVYSDTGTLGLNVRLLLKKQVFIASGPGIKVLKGNKYCHMAFLNSKIATCLLKIKNPKFTISAGYIGKLPVKEEILTSKEIAKRAKQAIKSKEEILQSKLPNIEFSHKDYSAITDIETYIDDVILTDIKNYKTIAVAEAEINTQILNIYKFNDIQYKLITEMIGHTPSKKINVSIEYFDQYISSILNECCMPISRKLNGCITGSDNILEMLSYEYNASISSIYNFILQNIRQLKNLRKKYKVDLIHKLILEVCGFESITGSFNTVSCDDILSLIENKYNYLQSSLCINNETIEIIIKQIHYKGFYNKPILVIK